MIEEVVILLSRRSSCGTEIKREKYSLADDLTIGSDSENRIRVVEPESLMAHQGAIYQSDEKLYYRNRVPRARTYIFENGIWIKYQSQEPLEICFGSRLRFGPMNPIKTGPELEQVRLELEIIEMILISNGRVL